MRARLTLLLLLALLATAAPAQASASADLGAAAAAGQRFLGRYLLPSGRVVRRDQGGDTAGAGQAQAMLVSAAVGDAPRFAAAWSWTRRHLERRDGLLASHWRAGRVVNAQAASDADLDAARALILAGRRFRTPAYRRAGARLAAAILARETTTIGGMRVLVAGPWAVGRRPAAVSPSYWAPRTFELLRAATGDRRFRALERSAARLAGALTSTPPHLPPDWAAVRSNGAVTATSVPGRRPTAPQFSFAAARLPIRFAESCDATARALSAQEWPFFAAQPPDRIGLAYRLDGTAIAPAQSAVTLVAAAAAAQVAGETAARDALLTRAESVDARFPTYYGAAWVALGRLELTTRLLGGCAS
jgi:endo-1,4-beta-D-glucanase Y